jgi:hypothetical protein
MYAVLHPPNFLAQAAAHERPELRKLYGRVKWRPREWVTTDVDSQTNGWLPQPSLDLQQNRCTVCSMNKPRRRGAFSLEVRS